MSDKKLKITLKKSLIGWPNWQRKTVKSLGLTKRNASVIQNDTPAVRGKVDQVQHLLEVEEMEA